MTGVQSWTLAVVALGALLIGTLMATGAVSFAQTGSPTPTPAATTPAATTAPTVTPAPDNSSGGSEATPTPAPKSGDRQGCPDKQQGTTSGTSTSNPQA